MPGLCQRLKGSVLARRFLKQQALKFVGSTLLQGRENVRVNVESDRHTRMAQPLADNLRMQFSAAPATRFVRGPRRLQFPCWAITLIEINGRLVENKSHRAVCHIS